MNGAWSAHGWPAESAIMDSTCMAISLAAYSPAAHFKARPSLVNLLVNGHVKGAWLWFR